MTTLLCRKCGDALPEVSQCHSCGRDPRRDLAGQGLSRFSKYTKEERKRIGRVTAILSGDKVSHPEPRGIKYGIRAFRPAEEHERASAESGTVAHVVVFTRWYASKKQRNDALVALTRKSTAQQFYGPLSKDVSGNLLAESWEMR